jgi:aminotransferase in exopolysaccharide biosynthesis
LSEPVLGGNERRYLDECIATNFVSSVGPFVDRFEKELARAVGARHAVACASGTAALHVAMRLIDLRPGDEVLVSTLTFIASANPVLYEGGTPVLVDSEDESWNMDPSLVIEELERRARAGAKMPKAVEVVHVLGHPARLDELAAACERHGVVLIEDAAEALGARWTAGRFAGRHAGTVGKIGCFSFNGNKIVTAGGGGMIVTDDEKLARRAKHLTTQARLPGLAYRHDEVGYNYRLTNIAAALGLAQLEQLDAFVARRRAIGERYRQALRGLPGVTPPVRAPWAAPTHWLSSILVDDRDALIERLRAAGVEARPLWTPLHTLPMYQRAPRLGGAVAERLFAHGVSLPSSVSLSAADQQRVIDVVIADVESRRRAGA